MKKTVSLFVAFMMLAMCVLPAAPAEASVGGDHTIEMREFPFYLTDPDITLSDPFPLYFIDGVDDLPYIEIEDLAGLLAFLNTDEYFGNDPDYGLNIDYNSEIVTLTRENGYTMEINFEKDTMVFDDYDAFIHGSNDTTLLDLVSEKGFDSEGNPSLIMRDKEASFDRYGDVLAIDLAGYDIDLLVKEQKYLIPLQTMSDFLFAVPLGNCVIFNGEALFLASDDALFDYSVGDYSALSDIFYSVEPRDERSDELAEYSYSELCLLLDTFYGLKEPHDIKNFSQIFWQIGYDEPLRGKSASDADIALKSFIDYYLDDLHSVFNEFSPMVGLNPISSSTGMSNRKITDFGKEYAAARAVYYPDGFLSYEEVGNTAYITFDHFRSGNRPVEHFRTAACPFPGKIHRPGFVLVTMSHSCSAADFPAARRSGRNYCSGCNRCSDHNRHSEHSCFRYTPLTVRLRSGCSCFQQIPVLRPRLPWCKPWSPLCLHNCRSGSCRPQPSSFLFSGTFLRILRFSQKQHRG